MSRVLIVNDEPDLVEACRIVLEGEGHFVYGTVRGRDARALATELRPDVIVLDWVMEDTRGDIVLRQLRQHPDTANIPVVMMSALADAATLSRSAGADAFLPKPFDLLDLVRAVAQLSQRGREQPRPHP